jgi:hypothetical protein
MQGGCLDAVAQESDFLPACEAEMASKTPLLASWKRQILSTHTQVMLSVKK